MAHTSFPVKEFDVLRSKTTRYLVVDFIGDGGFAKVAKCLDLSTNNMVAVKMFKESNRAAINYEIEMLEDLMALDMDKVNIVRFIESFTHLKLHCLVFEMLDMNVWDLIDQGVKKCKSLKLNEIRPMIHQLMTAFDALRREGIMHTDLKSDNIMLVDHMRRPYKIKLIDFGLAFPETLSELGLMIQTPAFRAPEVYLGAPSTTAVDMWALGCVMAHMYFGTLIFSDECPYEWMRTVMHLLGEPDQRTLSSGIYTYKYFKQAGDGMNRVWTLMTPEEYEEANWEEIELSRSFIYAFKDLEEAVLSLQRSHNPVEMRDRQEFLSLLKYCLTISPQERITPRQALSHNFLTMVHLPDDVHSVYAETALRLMTVALESDLDDTMDFNKDCTLRRSGRETQTVLQRLMSQIHLLSVPTTRSTRSQGTQTDNGSLVSGFDYYEIQRHSCNVDDKSRDLMSSTGLHHRGL